MNTKLKPMHYSQREIDGVKAVCFALAVLVAIAVAVGMIVILYKRA